MRSAILEAKNRNNDNPCVKNIADVNKAMIKINEAISSISTFYKTASEKAEIAEKDKAEYKKILETTNSILSK